MDLKNKLQQTFANPSRSIFINPNFNKPQPAHINPNFLVPKNGPSKIHLNPNFLQLQAVDDQRCAPQLVTAPVIPPAMQEIEIQRYPLQQPMVLSDSTVAVDKSKVQLNRILSKSRTKIVREPMAKPVCPVESNTAGSLVKIGLRKLVRGSTVPILATSAITTKALPQQNSSSISQSTSKSKYKIDRRRKEPLFRKVINRYRRKSFVGQYALRRCSETASMKKMKSPTKRSSTKSAYNLQNILHCQNKLQMIDINGVRYKSTKNKLQRNDATSNRRNSICGRSIVHKTGERILIVRGNKFILDKHGFKITRTSPTTKHEQNEAGGVRLFKRIDFGGLTYIAKSRNVFIRTGNHVIRNHVSTAKQKSINMLSRNLVKSNMPCAIYQRVGKCAAFERGKCMKVHDKMQISICQRFLRGECSQNDCLLSHNVSLSKMPVCKFFLQGCCIRTDCPYLHKKLSERTEICADFVKGFCKLAEQCNKRHEFLCPDFESKGKCERLKCIFCKRKKQQQQRSITVVIPDKVPPQTKSPPEFQLSNSETRTQSTENNIPPSSNARYFVKDTDELEKRNHDENTNKERVELCKKEDNAASSSHVLKPSRLKLGDLPAFIPFS